jgi:hypothetical protein
MRMMVFSCLIVLMCGSAFAQKEIPPGYISVPGGLAHPSCVHEVPNEAVIEGNDVFLDGQWIAHHEPCDYPAFRTREAPPSPATTGYGGWLEDTVQYALDAFRPFQFLRGDTYVPSPPADQRDQIVYFFQGLQATDINYKPIEKCGILQPVLGWLPNRPQGGAGYAISSWWWRPGNVMHSPWKNVKPGEHLFLNMNADTLTTWQITLEAPRAAANLNPSTAGTACVFNVAFPAVAEVDKATPIKACGQVPRSIFFQNILLGSGVWDSPHYDTYNPSNNIVICPNGVCPPNLSCGWHIQSGQSGGNTWTILYMR